MAMASSVSPSRQGLVNKLKDYGVPEGKVLGIKYGFRLDT